MTWFGRIDPAPLYPFISVEAKMGGTECMSVHSLSAERGEHLSLCGKCVCSVILEWC